MPHALRIMLGPNIMLGALLVVAYQVPDTGCGRRDKYELAGTIVWKFIKGFVTWIIYYKIVLNVRLILILFS